MSSASQCSRKVTIRGVKVDLDRYAVWSRSSSGALERVRHRSDLEKDADYVVVLIRCIMKGRDASNTSFQYQTV